MNGRNGAGQTFRIAAVAFVCIAAENSPPVTFESPCECRANHGEHRWVVKKIRRLRPQMPAQFSQ